MSPVFCWVHAPVQPWDKVFTLRCRLLRWASLTSFVLMMPQNETGPVRIVQHTAHMRVNGLASTREIWETWVKTDALAGLFYNQLIKKCSNHVQWVCDVYSPQRHNTVAARRHRGRAVIIHTYMVQPKMGSLPNNRTRIPGSVIRLLSSEAAESQTSGLKRGK